MSTNEERITIERTYRGAIEDVWELWTTKEGIESWWGPDGFFVTVRELDLRPGGVLRYGMTAQAPEMIAFMKKAGMPTTTESRLVFTEIVAPTRLAYLHSTDFIPGVAPYDVAHLVELEAVGDEVRLRLTIDRMHDEMWTGRAVAGWKNELGKLERALAERAASS